MRLELVPMQAGIMDVSMENVPDLRKRFAEETAGSAMEVMGTTAAAPGPLYDRMVAEIERILTDQGYQTQAPTMAATLRRPEIKDATLARPVAASALEQADALMLSIGYMYADAEREGGFKFRRGGTGPQVVLNTTRPLLEQAVLRPGDIEASLAQDRQLAQMQMTEGLSLSIREKLAAIDIAGLLQSKFEILAKAIRVAHALKEGKRRPFRDFFDDLVVLQSMAIVAADGLQRQFASRFSSQMSKGETYDSSKLVILNAVTRHAYVCAGIIEPQIQRIFKYSVDDEAHDRVRSALDERRVGRLLDRDQLRKRHELFWMQRQGIALPRRDGARIACDALTDLVRADGQALLEALDARALFRDVAEVGLSEQKCRNADADAREAGRVEIRGHLNDALRRPAFDALLRQRMAVWLPEVRRRLAEAAAQEEESSQS